MNGEEISILDTKKCHFLYSVSVNNKCWFCEASMMYMSRLVIIVITKNVNCAKSLQGSRSHMVYCRKEQAYGAQATFSVNVLLGKRDEVSFCAFVCFFKHINLLHICYSFLILVALSIHVFSVTGGLIGILTNVMILFPWTIMSMMFILQPMLQACARQLIEHIRYALSWK